MADEPQEGPKQTAEKPGPGAAPGAEEGKLGQTATATSAKPSETEVAARLDGMRGWLGDLHRTVGIRSRVGLVLAAIAIGGAGAAIYLSLDAKEQSASDRDVNDLRDQLQGVEQQAGETAQDVTSLQSTVDSAKRSAGDARSTAKSLQPQIKALQADVQDLQNSVSNAAAADRAAQQAAGGGGSTGSGAPSDTGGGAGTGGAGNP
ncbi:MAG: hypothetical protein AABM29_04435 [Actinomycetota bacterium]